MLSAFATPRSRVITFVLMCASVGAVIASAMLGGAGHDAASWMLLVAVGILILAFVHPWRQVKPFKYLFYAAGLGFAGFVILHNVADLGTDAATNITLLQGVLQAISITAFLIAVFICPPALVIGGGGAVIMFVRGRARGKPRLNSRDDR